MNLLKVTREMLVAGHKATMAGGEVVLSADLLTRIYEAMEERRQLAREAGPQSIRFWICSRCRASLMPDVARELDVNRLQDALSMLMSDIIRIGHRPGNESAMLAWGSLERLKTDFGIEHQCDTTKQSA